MSYVKDIQSFHPNDVQLMENVMDIFDKFKYYEEESTLLSSLMREMKTKDEVYAQLLLRSVRIHRARRAFKTALKELELYHSITTKREMELLQLLRREVQEEDSLAERAVALLDQSITIPKAPASLFQLQYDIQSIRHNPTLISRYLLQINPDVFETLFEKAEMDCEPYEVVITSLYSILQYGNCINTFDMNG